MSCPYDKDALERELESLEKQIKLFEDKAAELRGTVFQYKLWIEELKKSKK